MFGSDSPGKPGGITRQDVRSTFEQCSEEPMLDLRGLPPALPDAVVDQMVAMLDNIVSARTMPLTTTFLQPAAVGGIVGLGCKNVLVDADKQKRWRFCASREWLAANFHAEDCAFCAPCGATRKWPEKGDQMRRDMVLRPSHLAFKHDIPPVLAFQVDATGWHLRLMRCNSWFTGKQMAAKDKTIQGNGSKEQIIGVHALRFTNLDMTEAELLPWQGIVIGKTTAAGPKLPSICFTNARRSRSKCQRPRTQDTHSWVPHHPDVSQLGSLCGTQDHWSDELA